MIKMSTSLNRFYVCLVVLTSFILISASMGEEKERTMDIALVAVGKIDKEVIETLKNELSRIFKKQVFIDREVAEPDFAYNKQRNQYSSTAILRAILKLKEYNIYEKLLAIVDHDLYVPELNFVFGEATDRGGFISITRLRQEYYGLHRDDRLFQKRALIEAVHELGHTYGLAHCENPKCVMFFSNSLADTDSKGFNFCAKCARKLIQ